MPHAAIAGRTPSCAPLLEQILRKPEALEITPILTIRVYPAAPARASAGDMQRGPSGPRAASGKTGPETPWMPRAAASLPGPGRRRLRLPEACRLAMQGCTRSAELLTGASEDRRSEGALGSADLCAAGFPVEARCPGWANPQDRKSGHGAPGISITRAPSGGSKPKSESSGLVLVRIFANSTRVTLPNRSTTSVACTMPALGSTSTCRRS